MNAITLPGGQRNNLSFTILIATKNNVITLFFVN